MAVSGVAIFLSLVSTLRARGREQMKSPNPYPSQGSSLCVPDDRLPGSPVSSPTVWVRTHSQSVRLTEWEGKC